MPKSKHPNLDRFLTVAQRFKLEGLLGYEEKAVKVKEEDRAIPPLRIGRPEKFNCQQPKIVADDNSTQIDNQITPSIDTNDLNEIDEKLYENMEVNSDGVWCCKICNKAISRKKRNAKFHVETHMEGLSFPCNTCGKEFRSRNTLSNHKSLQKHQ